MRLLYHAYELQRAWLSGASAWASIGAELMSNPRYPAAYFGLGPMAAASLEVFAHATQPRGKPAFGIETVAIGGSLEPVTEAIVYNKPFGDLRRFTRDGLPDGAPKVLIVAPMSGHYATLLRGTVARMVEGAEVYITDWADARDVPANAGRFDLDDYIDYLIEFLAFIGPDAHVIAVCQWDPLESTCRHASLSIL